VKGKSINASGINKDQVKKSGKLLDRFKIRVSEQEFTIEIYNQDLTDENFRKYSVVVNGTPYSVEVESLELEDTSQSQEHTHATALSKPKPDRITPSDVPMAKRVDRKTAITPDLPTTKYTAFDEKTLSAPMPGKILEIKTKVGDQVDAGQPLVILEAMKMENVMPAPSSGTVKEIPIKVGQNVTQGEKLVIIE